MIMMATLVFALLELAAGLLPAADFPKAEISNGQIRVKLYLPDAKHGFYRSTRFDWSGVVYTLEYKGHNYYGPWFQKIAPNVQDVDHEGQDIVSTTYTDAVVGPAEEYQTNGTALGFDEAAAAYERLREAVRMQRPFCEAFPDGAAAQGLRKIARKVADIESNPLNCDLGLLWRNVLIGR